MTPISPEYTREDLIIMIHQRDGLVSDLKEVCEKNAARIEQLEARLDRAVTRGLEQVDRIATLEEALREIVEGHPEFLAHHLQAIARAALERDK